ncbi:hypothetical protein [Botrimarina sp.]|uniref:TSCPD domain-containing protein n=1 Tax=Botrimarina sp. TaxID=2795802 RepID=UPI0032EE0B44
MSTTAEKLPQDSRVEATRRELLPDTRESRTHKFKVGDTEGYLTVGLYPDGRPAELFVKVSKHGTTVSGLLDAIAALTSIALQHGVALDLLVKKFEYMRFEPSGWTTHDQIHSAHSLVDYIFRWLKLEFPRDEDTVADDKS